MNPPPSNFFSCHIEFFLSTYHTQFFFGILWWLTAEKAFRLTAISIKILHFTYYFGIIIITLSLASLSVTYTHAIYGKLFHALLGNKERIKGVLGLPINKIEKAWNFKRFFEFRIFCMKYLSCWTPKNYGKNTL